MTVAAGIVDAPDMPRLLSEAVARIAEFWRLSDVRLGSVLGLSAPTVSRLRGGSWWLEPGSKPFELAEHLLCLFHSLDSWLGQDDVAARSWLALMVGDAESRSGEHAPRVDRHVARLLRAVDYVDALRARV